MVMKNIEFGNAIRKKRLERHLKVFELAQLVDVNPVYITQIEKHGKLPSSGVMEKISSKLCDKGNKLLSMYLKIKYPVIYAERQALYPDVSIELEEIFKEIRRQNKTPEEEEELKKRIVRHAALFKKDKEALQRTLYILDLIEKIPLSYKRKVKGMGKLKEFQQTKKTMERFHT